MEPKSRVFLIIKFLFVIVLFAINIDVAVGQKTMTAIELTDSIFASKCNGHYIVIDFDNDRKTFAQFEKGRRVGQWITVNRNLDIGKIETYKKGKLDGFYSFFSPSGGLTGRYKNGLKNGQWCTSGETMTIENYKRGVLNGRWEYDDYQGYSIGGYYERGQRNGNWIYKHNNRIYLVEIYKKGILIYKEVSCDNIRLDD